MLLFGLPNVSKMKSRRDVKGLIKALGYNKDLRVCQEAARALGELGDSQAVRPLITALDTRNADLRLEIVRALGRLGDPQAVGPIINAFKASLQTANKLTWRETYTIESTMIDSLAEIGPQALQPLTSILGDENSLVREVIVEVLGRIGDPSAVERLAVTLRDGAKWVRNRTVEALAKLNTPRAIELITTALNDSDSGVFETAVRSLMQLGEAGRQAVVVALDTIVAGSWPGTDRVVPLIEALASAGERSAIGPLTEILKREDYAPVHYHAVEALQKLEWIPTEDFAGALYWILTGDYTTKLVSLAGDVAVEWKLLGDFQEFMALGEAAFSALIFALRHHNRAMAAYALGEMADPRAVEPLIEALSYTSQDYNLLEDNTVEYYESGGYVREAAAWALGRIGDPRAVQPLKTQLEKEKNYSVQARIKIALEKLEATDRKSVV